MGRRSNKGKKPSERFTLDEMNFVESRQQLKISIMAIIDQNYKYNQARRIGLENVKDKIHRPLDFVAIGPTRPVRVESNLLNNPFSKPFLHNDEVRSYWMRKEGQHLNEALTFLIAGAAQAENVSNINGPRWAMPTDLGHLNLPGSKHRPTTYVSFAPKALSTNNYNPILAKPPFSTLPFASSINLTGAKNTVLEKEEKGKQNQTHNA
ncbi:hypothetical protein Peur_010637 [Populus x canadensis]